MDVWFFLSFSLLLTRAFVEMDVWFFLSFSLLLTRGSSEREAPHISCHSNINEDHRPNSSNILLTLHHPRSPCSPINFPDLPFSEILRHDEARVRALSSQITQSLTTIDSKSVSVPLTSGIPIHDGNFITEIGLGTPSVNYVVAIDTGSSFSWIQCLPCIVTCHKQVGTIFNPNTSSTYNTFPCSATECSDLQSATSNPSRCTSDNRCVYNQAYGDGSFSVGYLSKDTLSLGSKTGTSAVLSGFLYGCGQNNQGYFGKTAGIIGLAKDKLSLTSQLSPTLGSSFSYCLPTTASSGYLSIGPYDPSQLTFTPMVSNSLNNMFYFLRLSAITVSGTTLPVASSSYYSLPTIIDSGTVITRLPSDVYAALSKAVVAAMATAKTAPGYPLLDTCFEGSVKSLKTPEVNMVFDGGAVLKLPAMNVFVDREESTCLAFKDAGNGTNSITIIGNTLQQSYKVVYDVGRSRIGFAPSGC